MYTSLAIMLANDNITIHTPYSPIIIILFPILEKLNISIQEWL